jgi:phosphate:Na+ symporter
VFGVIWVLLVYSLFLKLIGWVTATIFSLPNPAADNYSIHMEYNAKGVPIQTEAQTAALYGLSMLHTLFNTINTFILVWFVPAIEKLVCFVIKGPKNKEEEEYKLKYINAGPIATPELALGQSMNEIVHFANISRKGLGYVKSAIEESKTDEFEKYRAKLVKYEEISDRIESEIASFLNSVSLGDISEETSMKIKSMYKIIGELESLGDSGEAISRIILRKNAHQKSFDEKTIANLLNMVSAVDAAYEIMINNLMLANDGSLGAISNAYKAETSINELRNTLRDCEIDDIEDNKKNYQNSVYYIDLINELEKMGDFMINVSQELERSFVK